MKKRVLSILLVLCFVLNTVVAFGAEESTEETTDGRGGGYHVANDTLQDIIDLDMAALDAYRDFCGYIGDPADFIPDSYISDCVETVLSSFLAVPEDMLQFSIDACKASDAFMKHVYFNPFDKLLFWDSETVKIGHEILWDKFHTVVYDDTPPGFYPCTWQNYVHWTNGWYSWYRTDGVIVFFTNVNGQAVLCSMLTSTSTVTYYSYVDYSNPPTSDASGQWRGQGTLNRRYTFNGVNYGYALDNVSGGNPTNFTSLYPQVYASTSDALEAFYGYEITSVEVPNGDGYLRPLPEDTVMKATSHNVFNNKWGDIIINNYKTYGDTFESTVINNYYYTAPAPGTPDYWYNVPQVGTDIQIENTYDDLDDITLSDPNITSDNSFISDLFSALPAVMSTLIVSLFILTAVMIFFRG